MNTVLEPFDQLLYYETKEPLVGNTTGVHAAATSLDPEALKDWNSRLYPLVSSDHPYESLCYLVSGDQAALMYRSLEVASRIQPFSHVLIGRQVDLTPERALGSFGWNWHGAIRRRPELRELKKVDGDKLKSFEQKAKEGWAQLILTERPPEVDQLVVRLRDEGGPERGPLPFDDPDALSSLGDSEFVIFTRPDPELANDQRARQPVQVLARLLSMLDAKGDLHKHLIGSGFSTHERKYRSGQVALRWVFATDVSTDTWSIGRFAIDLRSIDGTSVQKNKTEADLFLHNFWDALKGHGCTPADSDSGISGTESSLDGTADATLDGSSLDGSSLDGTADPVSPSSPHTEQSPVPEDPAPEEQNDPEGASSTLHSQSESTGYDNFGSATRDPDGTLAPPTNPSRTMKDRNPPFGPDNLPVSTASGKAAQVPLSALPAYHSTSYETLDEPTGFARLRDSELIEKLSHISLDHMEPLTRELWQRATPEYQAGRRSRDFPVDTAQLRAKLIEMDFYASDINKHISERQLVTNLYSAICAFAISDQPKGKDREEVIDQFLGVLARNDTYQSPTSDGGVYSPLTLAIMASLGLTQDDSQKIVIQHDHAFGVARALGFGRMAYLGIYVAPAPAAEDIPQDSGIKARPFLSTKNEVYTLLTVVALLIVTVCIGYYI